MTAAGKPPPEHRAAAARSEPGPAVDQHGYAVRDPTENVLDLVKAAMQRQDDLRNLSNNHLSEMMILRAEHARDLRNAEAERINAIRAVDVGAVQRAAEVQATQAQTLAAQVTLSAETLRTQVSAAATAATTALAAALEPIQKDIADLRRVQYEGVGSKDRVVEARGEVADTKPVLDAILALTAAMNNRQGGQEQTGRTGQLAAVGISAFVALVAVMAFIVTNLPAK